MNSEDAFRAGGKSSAGGAGDGGGMRYRRNALHSQGKDLDCVGLETVCSSNGNEVNTLRCCRWCAAQGGGAIVMGNKCYARRQVARIAERSFRLTISGCNSKRIRR